MSFTRRITHDDIVSAAVWALNNAGDDEPVWVMAHRLLEHMAKSHEDSGGFHERTQAKCKTLTAEIESRFKVEGNAWDEAAPRRDGGN